MIGWNFAVSRERNYHPSSAIKLFCRGIAITIPRQITSFTKYTLLGMTELFYITALQAARR